MKIVVQRIKKCAVRVDGEAFSECGKGLLLLVGVEAGDTEQTADRLCEKILKMRIFEDENGKMNLSVKDISGSAAVVSNFTLASDIRHGNRPDFGTCMAPAGAEKLYGYFAGRMSENISTVTGVFGGDMTVELINDGPVTFVVDSRDFVRGDNR